MSKQFIDLAHLSRSSSSYRRYMLLRSLDVLFMYAKKHVDFEHSFAMLCYVHFSLFWQTVPPKKKRNPNGGNLPRVLLSKSVLLLLRKCFLRSNCVLQVSKKYQRWVCRKKSAEKKTEQISNRISSLTSSGWFVWFSSWFVMVVLLWWLNGARLTINRANHHHSQ